MPGTAPIIRLRCGMSSSKICYAGGRHDPPGYQVLVPVIASDHRVVEESGALREMRGRLRILHNGMGMRCPEMNQHVGRAGMSLAIVMGVLIGYAVSGSIPPIVGLASAMQCPTLTSGLALLGLTDDRGKRPSLAKVRCAICLGCHRCVLSDSASGAARFGKS
eukprot:2319105-Rhodomonas_salina.2